MALAGPRRDKSAAIRAELLHDIRVSPLNHRLPSDADLARRFGVNPLTISRVMTQLSRDGYVRRDQGRGTFVAGVEKVVNGHRLLRPEKANGEILVAFPDYPAYDIWQFVHHAENVARRRDICAVNLRMTPSTTYDAIVALADEHRDRLRGILIDPPGTAIDAKALAKLASIGLPVAVAAPIDAAQRAENVASVDRDHYAEGFLPIEHLIQSGHTRIGLVMNEPWSAYVQRQYEGVKAALYHHGLNLKDLVRSERTITAWENSMDAGYRFAQEMLREHRLTAIHFLSTAGAVGGLRAIYEAGLSVPRDISVTGVGELGVEAYLPPPLTTVAVEMERLVSAAFDLLLDDSRRHERQVVVDVQLIKRDSVRQIG